MSARPLIDDKPGQPPHPMTDDQYKEYLRDMEFSAALPMPMEGKITVLEEQNAEMRRMIEALANGDTGPEVTA